MIEIDGSRGEGGGQILRTALALSAVTKQPFVIDRIRAGRAKPGLAQQHLTCVNAAALVCGARVDGAALGSTRVAFFPGDVVHGDRVFSVGTAGATALVVQTVLPPLLKAPGRSRLVVEGGTHGKMAPPADFLVHTFVPLLRRMGADLSIDVERMGFFPRGGGRLVVDVAGGALTRLDLLERGRLRAVRVRALVSRLPRAIGEREVDVVVKGISAAGVDVEGAIEGGIEGEVVVVDTPGPGNAVVLELESESLVEVVTGFGEHRAPAEVTAQGVVDEALRYLGAGVPVGEHLADQLLLPMALGAGGSFRTLSPTPHTSTNIETIRRFLDVDIAVVEEGKGVVRIDVVV